jgi:hypothetical protein
LPALSVTRRVVPLLVLALLAAGGGAWAAWHLKPDPAVEPTVYVDAARMEKARVDPTPGLLERIQLGRVKPTQVRIGLEPSAAGKKRVENYCGAAAAPYLVQTSAKSGPVPDSAKNRGTARRILPDFGGRVRGSRVSLQSTLSDGTPWAADYRVRGRWTFISDGDSVVVRSERFWSRVARGLVRCGVIAGAGAGIGYLTDSQQPLQGAARGAAIGGGTCAAIEVAF